MTSKGPVIGLDLGNSTGSREPAKHIEMASTKLASNGKDDPEDNSLEDVPHADTSKIDRSAMWAAPSGHSLQ